MLLHRVAVVAHNLLGRHRL